MATEEDEIVRLAVYIPASVREEIERVQAELKKENPLFRVSLGQALSKIVLEHKEDHAGK